jgi:hypothetical protein
MYKCLCYKCNLGNQPFTKRTIQEHCKKNLEYLGELTASENHQKHVVHVQDCYKRTTELLDTTLEDSQSSRLLASSYFDLLMTLLICIDLDDAPIASPDDNTHLQGTDVAWMGR